MYLICSSIIPVVDILKISITHAFYSGITIPKVHVIGYQATEYRRICNRKLYHPRSICNSPLVSSPQLARPYRLAYDRSQHSGLLFGSWF